MTFVICIILLIWVASLSNRIGNLERKLKDAKISPSPEPIEPKLTPKQNLPAHGLFSEHREAPVQKPEEPHFAEKRDETEIATNWLNKIGVVALVLGMAFFFKYAIDQGWINEWTRVIIGFIVSGLLVYLGELWKEKYGTRAHALSGGGIALFYFTIYAGFQYYEIFSQPIAFIFMLLVAGLSVWLSFRYSSLSLGVLGFFGAYGSPLMLSAGRDQQIELFFYLSLLNITALIILTKKFWMELLFFAMLGTGIDLLAWGMSFSTEANSLTTVFFVIFTTLLYTVGWAILFRMHHAKNTLLEMVDKNSSFLHIFSVMFYFISVVALLYENYYDMLSPIVLLGSIIFFFTYALVDRLEFKNINYSLSFVGASLLVASAFWQFEGKALALALLAIALLGTTLGALLKREELRIWSLIILFISLFKSLIEPYGVEDKHFLFNAKFGLMFANTLAILFMGWLYGKFEAGEKEKNAEEALEIVAAIVLWLTVSWDIFTAFGFSRSSIATQQFMTFWWVVYPAALATAAAASKRTNLLKVALILMFAALFKVLATPYGLDSPLLFNAKFGLMVGQTVVILFVANLYQKSAEKKDLPEMLKVVASMLLWFAVSLEIVEYFKGSASSNARNLLLSFWWIIYAVILTVIGGVTKSLTFRKVAIALFALSILKVFLYDVQTLDTPYRIISFIVLGVILLSVSFGYQKNKEKITEFLEGEKVKNA